MTAPQADRRDAEQRSNFFLLATCGSSRAPNDWQNPSLLNSQRLTDRQYESVTHQGLHITQHSRSVWNGDGKEKYLPCYKRHHNWWKQALNHAMLPLRWLLLYLHLPWVSSHGLTPRQNFLIAAEGTVPLAHLCKEVLGLRACRFVAVTVKKPVLEHEVGKNNFGGYSFQSQEDSSNSFEQIFNPGISELSLLCFSSTHLPLTSVPLAETMCPWAERKLFFLLSQQLCKTQLNPHPYSLTLIPSSDMRRIKSLFCLYWHSRGLTLLG